MGIEQVEVSTTIKFRCDICERESVSEYDGTIGSVYKHIPKYWQEYKVFHSEGGQISKYGRTVLVCFECRSVEEVIDDQVTAFRKIWMKLMSRFK